MSSDNNDNNVLEQNDENVVKEVAEYILFLLPIVEQGFEYVSTQIKAGKVEDSTAILEELAKAISSVSSAMETVFIEQDILKDLKKSLKDFKETVRKLIPLYASNDTEILNSVLNEEIIPSFKSFKDELESSIANLNLK